MKKTGVLFLAASLMCLPLFAGISFNGADVNLNDEVLFTATVDMAGTNPYKSLFYTHLKDGEPDGQPKLLTCYPEQMELLNGGKILQIRNRYGVARYSSYEKKLEWVSRTSGMPVNSLPIAPYSVSPDGKYYCKIEKTNLCSGALIIENADTGKTAVLNDSVINSYESVPVKWAPDSSILIYEKAGNVYFCNPEAVLRNVEIEEKYRRIGRGTINSVDWASGKYLAYVDDYLLYKINTKELYTLGLYAGIIGKGKAMGRLPFQFNPMTDRISSNAEVTSLVVIQNSKLFTYLKVQNSSCDYMDVLYSRPYTDNSASLVDTYIFWNASDCPILWQEKLPYNADKESGSVYKLTSECKQVLEIEDSGKPFISPDGKKIAFFAGATIYIYDINSWIRLAELSGEKITSALWADNNLIYVGGDKSIRKWNISGGNFETISLSSINAGYWDDTDYSILAETHSGNFYKYVAEKGTWLKIPVTSNYSVLTQNGRYRVFTGTTTNKSFDNALYVRTLTKKAVTKPVFPESVIPTGEKKKVALVFDAYDNADGLPKILSSLKKFNVKGSFFLNGEFIRRYPSETKQIVKNGHSCSSMFFTTTNLTDKSFVMDEDFIRRGLARNEDEFYNCTGKELNLLWHAPYFQIEPESIKYGENAGYKYIQSYHEKNDYNSPDLSPEQLIQKYYETVSLTKGGIVPVTIGFTQGSRKEPLYNYLDLLISALIDAGYDLVDINDL